MSPERAGAPQEEPIAAPKMSVPASPVAGVPTREARSPMSILLAVAQSQVARSSDDDLTNLAWLHERDLLKGMNIVNPSPSNSVNSTPIKSGAPTSLLSDHSPTSDYIDDSSASTADSSNSSLNSPIPPNTAVPPHHHHHQQHHQHHHQHHHHHQQQLGHHPANHPPPPAAAPSAAHRNKHPHNVAYDPLIHTGSKPPYSFSCLIFMAIEDSEQKALPVKEIYTWIVNHFPYFRTAPMGWKNSVRHNLSLNKCFQKIEKAPNLGKGSLWTVDQQYRPNLLQALTRSPFHRCSTLDPSVYFNKTPPSTKTPRELSPPPSSSSAAGGRLPNPELFPYLSSEMSRRIRSGPERSAAEDSLDEVDAAAVMLSLRNGLRHPQGRVRKQPACQVITTSPSQDHTYSAAESSYEADEAFESEDEGYLKLPKSSTCRRIDFEDEEERKIKEGAETLLNLAGITTRKRSASGCFSEDSEKRIRIDSDDRRPQFRPRLLRKKKDAQKANNNNNNNNIVIPADDAWVKHRRELEIGQRR